MRISGSVKGLENLQATGKQIKLAILIANTKLFNAVSSGEDGDNGTPVDTGFARASWWMQVDSNPGTHPSPPVAGAQSPAPVANPAALLAGVGRVFSVVNSANYIRRLEYDGYSGQNVGWVNRAAEKYPQWLNDALDQAKVAI